MATRTTLTEQHIGNALFHKPSDYSPLEDSSVRVHVRQLRLKLHEYFNEDGRNEPIILEIPKGLVRAGLSSGSESRRRFPRQPSKGDSSLGIVLASDAALGPVCFSGPCCAECWRIEWLRTVQPAFRLRPQPFPGHFPRSSIRGIRQSSSWRIATMGWRGSFPASRDRWTNTSTGNFFRVRKPAKLVRRIPA